MQSWLHIPEGSDFSLYNIPFGIFSTQGTDPRAATRIGNHVVDLHALCSAGFLQIQGLDPEALKRKILNDFIGLGKTVTTEVREKIQNLFSAENTDIQHDNTVRSKVLFDIADVQMHMPVHVGDYTDFYSSMYHATNVGSMFRPDNPLLPNWKHLPVAYHGRSSSIVVSGTDIIRPKGQFKPADSDLPIFGESRALDFELEMAFIIGKESKLGESVTAKNAEEYIFGFVLFNDWSARDIQSWEYQPLGPFLSKNFHSSVSPWIVTLEALEPFRVASPKPETELLPYLKTEGKRNFDIQLEVYLKPEGYNAQKICNSNYKYMYWNICQQLAHHTISGCNIKTGDMMASGTISGPEKDSRGCMLELTWRGKEPLKLSDGVERSFLMDGDTVTIKGFAQKDSIRVGFGEVVGKILPAL